MNLRPVGLEACWDLADLHEKAFDRPWALTEFESLLNSPGVFAVLGSSGEPEEARGFILCRAIAGEAEILTIAAGIATEAKAFDLFLEVAADNTAAIALYGATGFSQVGLRKGYYPHPDGAKDAVVMRRALNT